MFSSGTCALCSTHSPREGNMKCSGITEYNLIKEFWVKHPASSQGTLFV